MGCADQLGSAPEFGARAGRRDFRLCFPAADQGAREGLKTGAGFDRDRFAGQHGLVEQDFSTRELHVGRYYAAERELHQVPRHKVRRGHSFPGAVASHGRGQREARFQGRESCLGAALLE